MYGWYFLSIREGKVLAKKWQDVEFVDYKERQKRRRLKRRQQASVELKEQVTGRWNLVLIISSVSVFLIIATVTSYYLMRDRSVLAESVSRMYIEVADMRGLAFARNDRVSDWRELSLTQRFSCPYFFRTEDQSNVILRTHDGAQIKMQNSSELLVESIEVYGQERATKSNLRVSEGDSVFDSRNAEGALIEIALDSFVDAGGSSVVVYASPSLFKTAVRPDLIEIKLSRGFLNVEYQSERVRLEADTALQISLKEGMGDVFRFNPLNETW